MQVILLEHIGRLGKTGDVVEVKNGFGRNFLLPRGKALRATKDNIAYFESKREEIEAANASKTNDAEAVAKVISGAIVPVVEQAGEDGRLYGSVNAAAIAAGIKEKTDQTIDKDNIVISAPIKYIGVHTVPVSLFGNVTTDVHVNIARSQSELLDAEKRFKAGEIVMEGPDGEQQQEDEQPVEELVEAAANEAPAEETAEAADADENADAA